MAVDKLLMSTGAPRRMGAAAFTLASTTEEAFGGWSHRVTAVYGTESTPAPNTDVATRYPIPPGPVPPGGSMAGQAADGQRYWPLWSAVAHALPFHTQRPVGGGYQQGLRLAGDRRGREPAGRPRHHPADRHAHGCQAGPRNHGAESTDEVGETRWLR